MTFLDKTFCASPQCKNECGRKMTDEEKERLKRLGETRVLQAYFCSEPKGLIKENNEIKD